MRLFIDGALVQQQIAWGNLKTGDRPLYISATAQPKNASYIDDVRIYSCALSEKDIKALAQGKEPDL